MSHCRSHLLHSLPPPGDWGAGDILWWAQLSGELGTSSYNPWSVEEDCAFALPTPLFKDLWVQNHVINTFISNLSLSCHCILCEIFELSLTSIFLSLSMTMTRVQCTMILRTASALQVWKIFVLPLSKYFPSNQGLFSLFSECDVLTPDSGAFCASPSDCDLATSTSEIRSRWWIIFYISLKIYRVSQKTPPCLIWP